MNIAVSTCGSYRTRELAFLDGPPTIKRMWRAPPDVEGKFYVSGAAIPTVGGASHSPEIYYLSEDGLWARVCGNLQKGQSSYFDSKAKAEEALELAAVL
jgi:hypothetical protein